MTFSADQADRARAPRPPASVIVVGGGPAGMTAALLLARAGHPVTILEAAAELGGLWASRRDVDGYYRGDNSCKVYQSSYRTAPALLELLGTHWEQHFVGRHDLTTDWLHPFLADCSWRDLATLAGAYAQHRLGLGRHHEVSVAEFLATRGVSEPCRDWMRATALGGIAGTTRMTMWELFHRIGSNLGEILRGARGPLYWNAQPPNAPGGFVARWCEALIALGVTVRTGAPVATVSAWGAGRGVLVRGVAGEALRADAALLAVPPSALEGLFRQSDPDLAAGFGLDPQGVAGFFAESKYEHLGICWFFDRGLPRDLPLGGHNVRRGWHPILVQHAQYGAHLRPPAATVVVGSVAIDTEFRHQTTGRLAREHTHEEIATLLWADERAVDPSLPEPIDIEIMGLSNATQIVSRGPLALAMRGGDVFLATNLHGQAPYFTASLETAIQAGALAAARFDPHVERLPMGRAPVLPWGSPRAEVSAPLPRVERDAAFVTSAPSCDSSQ